MAKVKQVTEIGSTTSTLSIPSPVREAQNTASTDNGLDLLAQFAGSAPVKPKENKSKATLDIGKEGAKTLRLFCTSKVAFDLIESQKNAKAAEIRIFAMPAWLKLLWDSETRPSSPILSAEGLDGKTDVEALFTVQEKFKIQGSNPQQVIEALIAFGVDKIQADALVKAELDFSPTVSINFNELMNGKQAKSDWIPATAEEKAVANKALKLLMSVPDTAPLTDAEKGLLIDRKPRITVKDGYFQRVVQYADTFEQLVAIFKVIDPTDFASHAKFGVSDTPENKSKRLIEAFGDILGVKVAVTGMK